MTIQSISHFNDTSNGGFDPFSSDNLTATTLILVGLVAFAYINRQPFNPSSQSDRIIHKIEEPQTQVVQEEIRPQVEVSPEDIEALQEENETLKCELAEFEGGILHPLIDTPMKVGKIALLEERALLKERIAIGRQKKLERIKPKISASKAGEILIQTLNKIGYSLPIPSKKELADASFWTNTLALIQKHELQKSRNQSSRCIPPKQLQKITTAIEKRIAKLNPAKDAVASALDAPHTSNL